MILTRGRIPSVNMSNVLSEEKKQQVIALGRLGWSLRKIQKATGVHRTTAADYLRAAGIPLRPPGAWGKGPPAKPTNEVTPDSGSVQPAFQVSADSFSAKPTNEVTPDSGAELAATVAVTPPLEPRRSSSASACEAHRKTIELWLSRGRNAKAIWQDLVDIHGFAGGYQSVKRFVRQLRGRPSAEACAVIETGPGEESQVDYGTGPMVRDYRTGKYRRTRLFVLTLGYSRKSVRSPGQPEGGGPPSRHLRSHAESPVSRCLDPLRCGGRSLPCERSRSEGEGGVRCWACEEDAAQGSAL